MPVSYKRFPIPRQVEMVFWLVNRNGLRPVGSARVSSSCGTIRVSSKGCSVCRPFVRTTHSETGKRTRKNRAHDVGKRSVFFIRKLVAYDPSPNFPAATRRKLFVSVRFYYIRTRRIIKRAPTVNVKIDSRSRAGRRGDPLKINVVASRHDGRRSRRRAPDRHSSQITKSVSTVTEPIDSGVSVGGGTKEEFAPPTAV